MRPSHSGPEQYAPSMQFRKRANQMTEETLTYMNDEPVFVERRRFLRTCSIGLAFGGLFPFEAVLASSRRELTLFNTHTQEKLSMCYFRDGEFLTEACQRLNHLLRDHRTGDVHAIDPRLYDMVYAVQTHLGHRGKVEIISGYRSPATNARLQNASSGVAKHSQHMLGKALDIRLSGLDTARVRDAAIELQAGGVGYYAKSDFVHIDTGRVRRW